MKARVGTPKAITATAHELARWSYTLRKHGTVYVRQSLADDEHAYRDRLVQSLTRRAQALGEAVGQTPVGPPQ